MNHSYSELPVPISHFNILSVPAVNTPPRIFNCPDSFIITAAPGSQFTQVTFTPSICFDTEDGQFAAVCDRNSGANLGEGLTNINCECTDNQGLTDSCAFAVTVEGR